MAKRVKHSWTDSEVSKRLFTGNDVFNETGLTERTLEKYEGDGYLKPAKIVDGIKFYSASTVNHIKTMNRFVATGLPLKDSHEMALEGMSSKGPSASEADSVEVQPIDPKKIKTHPDFEGLLRIDDHLLKKITADMAANGYDEFQPVMLATWPGQEERVIIDGHTRLKAALNLGITKIYFVRRKFKDEMAALKYAMNRQSKRRTTTDGALYRLCERYDTLNKRGGDRRSEQAKSKPTNVGIEKKRSESSAHKTGSFIGCHYKKVERIRKIRKDGTRQIKEAVRDDKMTISKAYNLILQKAQGEDGRQENADKEKRQAAKTLLTKKNLAALDTLDGNVEDHINKAVQQYIERHQRKEATG